MTILFRKSEPRVEERGTVQLPAYAVRMLAESTGGVFVDGDSSMRHDAVWSCRTKIAQDVSMLPVDVVRYVGGRRQLVEPVPQIIAAPSVSIPSLDWRYQVVDSWLGWGNAWGLVTATTADLRYPLRIELQSPADVRWEDRGNGLEFFVNEQREELWPVGRLWHRPAYTLPGSMIGLSPIQYHRVKIGLGISAEKFGADFFTDGGHPSAILAVPGSPTEEQAKGLKERLMQLTRGNREPLVLPAETKYIPIQVNPEDSQFIESQRYTVEQVCRIFGEDPTDHGASTGGSAVTYANRLDAEAARIKRRQFWITKLQDALTEMLPEPAKVRLNTSAFLMMTPAERHALYGVRLGDKTITVNEVRTLEDETPFGPEYDAPGVPDEANTRQLSVAEAVQKVYLGVGTVLTADEAREIINEAGGSLAVPGPDLAAPTGGGDGARSLALREEEMRRDEFLAALLTREQRADTHIHLPDSLSVEMRQDPIVIPAPIVNVPAAEVTVNVPPAEVVVNIDPVVVPAPNVTVSPAVTVSAPDVVVNMPDPSPERITFSRDSNGRIIGAKKDPA